MLLNAAGCTSTRMYTYSVTDKNVICGSVNADLGNVAVITETAWRSDQKEPIKRKKMALNEIRKAFKTIPCGNISLPDGIKNQNWSNLSEMAILKNYTNKDIDTVILIRVEELSPRLKLTYSLPFLWSGTSVADFHIRMVSVKTGEVLNDMRVKRITGGPFNIRPAKWSGTELNAALRSILKKGY